MASWQEGFHMALYGYVLEHGGLVKEKLPRGQNYGGWRDTSEIDWSDRGELFKPDSPTGDMGGT